MTAPSVPGFWMDESSGRLAPAVMTYLEGGELDDAGIAVMRAYLRQWIGATVWDQNPHADDDSRAWLAALRADIDGLTSREAIADWLERAEEGGVDPL